LRKMNVYMVTGCYGSRQLQQSGLVGQQPGKALLNSKSNDHENMNIFYKKIACLQVGSVVWLQAGIPVTIGKAVKAVRAIRPLRLQCITANAQ
jgi:hypothetical protein